jgi:hypothetical protein
VVEQVRVSGLREFNRALKRLDSNLPKAVRLALNEATDVIIDKALPKVPSRSGRARASLKARSTRTSARVSGGSARAPYYPWLDFGGQVGRNKSVRRAFLKEGRYLYRTYFDHQDEFVDAMQRALVGVARQAGVVVD